jgi:protein-glutamine gamma-glutamyltransferase
VVDQDRQHRVIRGATLAMTALATASVELGIAEPDRSTIASLAVAAAMMIPVLALGWYLGRSVRWRHNLIGRSGEVSPLIVVALLVLLALPFVLEAGRAFWFGSGRTLEVLLLASVRNLGLGLAALSRRTAFLRMSALVSLFLVAVSSAMAEGATMIVIVVLFAAAGSLWLMRSYWSALRFDESSGRGSRFPVGTVGLILGVVGSVFAAAAVGPTRAATVLAGLMPTSGGMLWNDPDALGGVNDGDNEVRGSEKPESVGFTESEIYLETDRPSLYDAFSEQYGEPFKRIKQERMIALGQQDVRGQKDRPAENLRAGRHFPLVRQKPTAPTKKPGERQAKALLYIKGPCPIHLPLVTYDRFDGVEWDEEPCTYQSCPLEQEPGDYWLRLANQRPLIFADVVTHQIKIGTLESSPLPVPAHLFRFRVGSVNRLDFFGWAQDGIIKMIDRTVPAGTMIETVARTVDARRLGVIDFAPTWLRSPERYRSFADRYQIDPAVRELAGLWTSGLPRGWSQVEFCSWRSWSGSGATLPISF